MEGTPAVFIEKAAQCRRLAAGITVPGDPAIGALLALADEFEAKAADLGAADKTDQPTDKPTA